MGTRGHTELMSEFKFYVQYAPGGKVETRLPFIHQASAVDHAKAWSRQDRGKMIEIWEATPVGLRLFGEYRKGKRVVV